MTTRMSDERLELFRGFTTIGWMQECVEEIDRLRAENEKYRKALEFYANGENYEHDSTFPHAQIYPILLDGGLIASKALGGGK